MLAVGPSCVQTDSSWDENAFSLYGASGGRICFREAEVNVVSLVFLGCADVERS